MTSDTLLEQLADKSVKPTANRLLVLRALSENDTPFSLSELEEALATIDKSSIFRTLSLFLSHDIVHAFEDGRGVLKYELCSRKGHCDHGDAHIHFYCESCKQTFCFKALHIPEVELPDGFTPHSINYMIKGECPKCKSSRH